MSDERLPPVLLVHGFGSSFEHNWREPGWADLLADAGREVIGPDLLGHGSAPKPADPSGYAGVEDAVAAVIERHVPVDAIGFSMGARVLLSLAVANPARFRKLVLIGVGLNLFRDDNAEPLAAGLENAPADDDVVAQLFVRLADSAGNDRRALAAFLRHRRPPFSPADLARVATPVLVVIGDQDFVGPADPLVEALPDARLVSLRGVDHFSAPRDFRCIDAALEFVDAVA